MKDVYLFFTAAYAAAREEVVYYTIFLVPTLVTVQGQGVNFRKKKEKSNKQVNAGSQKKQNKKQESPDK